jgi:hypothetical protein
MTRVENFSRFQVFVESLMFHAWKKSPLLCRVVRWGKMFSLMHSCVTRMSSGSNRKSFRSLIVALRIATGVELKTHRHSSACFLPWFLFARNWHDQFLATPRSNAKCLQCLLAISCNSLCSNWKHFSSRVLSGDFFHAWNIKLSMKTWNQLKFSTRVISKVYCFMIAIIRRTARPNAFLTNNTHVNNIAKQFHPSQF